MGALEGVGALILSPDNSEVLLVWEHGHWKMITGNLDGCDSVVGTMRREVTEECGVELHDDAHVVGGWQDAQAYDARGNNSLPSVSDVDATVVDPKLHYGMQWEMGDPERGLISRVVPRYLSTWTQGRSLRISVNGKRTSFL